MIMFFSVCQSVYLSVCLFIYLSICQCSPPSICLSVHPSACLIVNLSIDPFILPLIHNKSTFISFSLKCYACRRDTSATDIFTQFHKIWHTLRNRFWRNDFQLCLLHPQKFNIFCNLRVALKRLCICLLEDFHDKNISLKAIHYLCSNIMNSGYSWLLSLHLSPFHHVKGSNISFCRQSIIHQRCRHTKWWLLVFCSSCTFCKRKRHEKNRNIN